MPRKLDLDVREIVRRYVAGESARALGRAYGVSCPTIRKRLRDAGMCVRGRAAPIRADVSTHHLAALLGTGLSARQAAKRVGMSYSAVIGRLQRAGIDTSGRRGTMGGWSTANWNAYVWYRRQLRRERGCDSALRRVDRWERSIVLLPTNELDQLPAPRPQGAARGLGPTIDRLLSTITFKERAILRLRFGLIDGRCHAQKDIARQIKVSPGRVRQLETKAIRKLQHPCRARMLRPFLDSAP
jgi:DNA-directed RNA polymerase specialized sigma24 family protein